jgi:hypothetical protein
MAIELEGVPIGIGKQMLQALGGSARECRSDGVAVLALEVGEEPGYVALQGLAALGATKQGDEGLAISGKGSLEALGTESVMFGLWSMPTSIPQY